jgi:hypothetical protein
MESSAAQAILMYFILPAWLAAGFADYLCHRASSIETTSGWKETLLHLLQFGEMVVPTLAAILLEINALVIATMIVCLVAHEATAIWDVSYAYQRREVTPTEQHVHSFLEMLPLMGLLIVVILHWQQFLALFGFGREAAEFAVRLKDPPLPWLYVTIILSLRSQASKENSINNERLGVIPISFGPPSPEPHQALIRLRHRSRSAQEA